ncbi:Bug family tripartite tricarboxylate transporter substrate binding protein [Paracraurococcus lichenis]|uniref:Tripartite tricarboxylate transporter substrate binding protein n=1 Tax=Paracraurococcus lichenis TaxID=3064888 RepID=A0ABT9DV92_9PROT|nr:tripartite tricarboxylate transporter substrate binding protein [Paracraurococcus sp. LOR1-02]MDO9707715.1 tripartite tricarboxylate transporter substrate binding protein [Paracraurococcus sp. LOR1-02]
MAMPPLRRRALLGALAASPAALTAPGRAAEAWPSRPVRLVVGYPAGASTDICARILAEDMRTRLPQPVVVENRPGANGSLGAAFVAAAEPDGHTLLVSNTSTMTANHLLYRDIRYQPLRDLLPLASITISPFILAASPKSPRSRGFRSVADLVAAAKASPGGLTYGSAGNGNLQHLNMELFCTAAGIRLLHVPFRGAAPAQNALVAGEVDLVLETPSTTPLLKSGLLIPLACTGATRWRDLPDVPTLAESGWPDFVATFWNGLVAPAGLPLPILERLVWLMEAAAAAPATRQLLLAQGEVMVLRPEAFRDRIAADIERNAQVIRSAGIELQ